MVQKVLNYVTTAMQDTYTDKDNPTANYGTGIYITVKGLNTGMGLLRFTLGIIPNNAIITAATLQLYHLNGVNIVDKVYVHDVLEPWDEMTASYNHAPAINPTPYTSFNAVSTTNTVDIKDLVQSWVNGKNYGLALTRTYNSTLSYGSSVVGTESARPILNIEYTIPEEDKKQVEVIFNGSVMSATVNAGESIVAPFTGAQIKDTLVVYANTPLELPEGWTLLSSEPYYTSLPGDSIFIAYKQITSEQTAESFKFTKTRNYVIISSQVYRNVKRLYHYGVTSQSGITQNVIPSNDITLLPNNLLVGVMASLNSINSVSDKRNFFDKLVLLGVNRSLALWSSYNHDKTLYTVSELSNTVGSAQHNGLKYISLEPVANEAPHIDGQDEDLGAFSVPVMNQYTVSDTEGDAITIKEKVNGVLLATKTGGGTHTVDISSIWSTLPLAKHTITIEVTDSYDNPPHEPRVRTWTFSKILPDNAKFPAIIKGLGDAVTKIKGVKQQLVDKFGGAMSDTFEDLINDIDRWSWVQGTIISNSQQGTAKTHTGGGQVMPMLALDMTMLPFVPKVITLTPTNKSVHNGTTTWYLDDFYRISESSYANVACRDYAFRCPYTKGILELPVYGVNMSYEFTAIGEGARI